MVVSHIFYPADERTQSPGHGIMIGISGNYRHRILNPEPLNAHSRLDIDNPAECQANSGAFD